MKHIDIDKPRMASFRVNDKKLLRCFLCIDLMYLSSEQFIISD